MSTTEWGVEYRGVTVYESEAEARRQLNFAQMDVPAVLVSRQVTVTEWQPAPVPKTREEMAAFAKRWDERVEAGRERQKVRSLP